MCTQPRVPAGSVRGRDLEPRCIGPRFAPFSDPFHDHDFLVDYPLRGRYTCIPRSGVCKSMNHMIMVGSKLIDVDHSRIGHVLALTTVLTQLRFERSYALRDSARERNAIPRDHPTTSPHHPETASNAGRQCFRSLGSTTNLDSRQTLPPNGQAPAQTATGPPDSPDPY